MFYHRFWLTNLLKFLLHFKQVTCEENGHCIWYGECYTDGLHKKNCPYDGVAKPLDSEGQKLLAKHCPHLLVNNGSAINTCCDVNQLVTIDTNIQLASNFLKRCPSCLDNLAKHFCDFTCATNQSKFINITEKVKTDGNYRVLFHHM